jgi:hypothetical protein
VRSQFIAVVAAFLVAGVFVWARAQPGDTAVYRLAAERYVRGDPIYSQQDSAAFTYPPLFVLAYVPFYYLPTPWDRWLWTSLNLLLLWYVLTCVIHIVWKHVADKLATLPLKVLWVAFILVASFRLAISPITYQSHEYIVLALITLGIRVAPQGTWKSGIAWGCAAACKATPLLFLVLLLWQRRWAASCVMLLTLAIATFLPDVIVPDRLPGPRLWQWYQTFVKHVGVADAPDVPGAWRSWNVLNQSISGTIYRLTTPVTSPDAWQWNVCLWPLEPHVRKWVDGCAKALVLTVLLWGTWIPSSIGRVAPAVWLSWGSTTLCAMLLLSPMSSRQHFCALVPAIVTVGTDVLCYLRERKLCTVDTIAIACVLLVGTLAGKDVIGADLHRQLAAYGSYTWCAMVLLIATAIASRRWAGRQPGHV